MKLFFIAALLALLAGCVIHQPAYYTVYTPVKPLTNNVADELHSQVAFPMGASLVTK